MMSMVTSLVACLSVICSVLASPPQLTANEACEAIMEAVRPLSIAGLKRDNLTTQHSSRLLREIFTFSENLKDNSQTLHTIVNTLKSDTGSHSTKAHKIAATFKNLMGMVQKFENLCPSNIFTVNHDGSSNNDQTVEVQPGPAVDMMSQLLEKERGDFVGEYVAIDKRVIAAAQIPTGGLEEAKLETLQRYGEDAIVSVRDLMSAIKMIGNDFEAVKKAVFTSKLVMYKSAVGSLLESEVNAASLENNVFQLGALVSSFPVDTIAGASRAVGAIVGTVKRVQCIGA